jgi:hypothetical protein
MANPSTAVIPITYKPRLMDSYCMFFVCCVIVFRESSVFCLVYSLRCFRSPYACYIYIMYSMISMRLYPSLSIGGGDIGSFCVVDKWMLSNTGDECYL